MKVTQLSVFLENKSGRLAALCRSLGENNVNIRAMSIADTSDFGILRLIVDQPEMAHKLLKEIGFAVNLSEVIAVEVKDKPGGLADILEVVQNAGLNVEYVYAFLEKASDDALVILRLDDLEKGINILNKHGVPIVPQRRICAL